MAESQVRLRVHDLSKTYVGKNESVHVLDCVSFEVRENEFLVILGPGQCGKTVLLNIMANMDSPSEGGVTYFGEQGAGFVFQRYALFPWKTVLDNVAAPLKYQGIPRKTRNETAMKYIRLVGLLGFEKAYPAQLSGGMKQRAGIARAYASGKNIIFMDEPFGALDAQTRCQMQDELLKIRSSQKTTIVFVTNNIEEAVYLGDRILLFSNKPSRIVEEYIPGFERPRNKMSEQFLKLRNDITEKMDMAL